MPGGFGALTPEDRRRIASLGGKALHAAGKRHCFQAGEEAKECGRKGGRIVHAKGNANRFTSQQAREAGRLKGLGKAVERLCEESS